MRNTNFFNHIPPFSLPFQEFVSEHTNQNHDYFVVRQASKEQKYSKYPPKKVPFIGYSQVISFLRLSGYMPLVWHIPCRNKIWPCVDRLKTLFLPISLILRSGKFLERQTSVKEFPIQYLSKFEAEYRNSGCKVAATYSLLY
jgi:hypothetical protein